MLFKENKIYSAVNADEVKVGSIGFFATNMKDLQKAVEGEYASAYYEVKEICDTDKERRFTAKAVPSGSVETFPFFYLVEDPKPKKEYRPYESTDELMEDFRKRICGFAYEGNLPFVWIKEKNGGDGYLITGFIKDDSNTYCVLIGTCFISLAVLFESYTYIDGSPCGKKI